MFIRQKNMGKFKILSGGFCLRDSEAAEQRALQFLFIYYSM